MCWQSVTDLAVTARSYGNYTGLLSVWIAGLMTDVHRWSKVLKKKVCNLRLEWKWVKVCFKWMLITFIFWAFYFHNGDENCCLISFPNVLNGYWKACKAAWNYCSADLLATCGQQKPTVNKTLTHYHFFMLFSKQLLICTSSRYGTFAFSWSRVQSPIVTLSSAHLCSSTCWDDLSLTRC